MSYNEKKEKGLTKAQARRLIKQAVTDDTYWDDMDGVELKKRVGSYLNVMGKSDSREYSTLVAMMSCLRLCPIIYLRKKIKKEWNVPILNHPNGPVIPIFTSADEVQSEILKPYKKESIYLSYLLEDMELDEKTAITINPDTDFVTIPVSIINYFFKLFDEIVNMTDQRMQEGIAADDLDELTFEHFFCRDIECELQDGSIVKGQVKKYVKKSEYGSYLLVDTENDGYTHLFKNQVKTIKDVTIAED